jgi:hypothetical protein
VICLRSTVQAALAAPPPRRRASRWAAVSVALWLAVAPGHLPGARSDRSYPGVGTAVGGAVGGTAGAIGGAVVGSGAGSWAADQASDLSAGLGQRIVQGAAHARRATEGMRDTVGDVTDAINPFD